MGLLANPARFFWAFVTVHLVAWTLIPALICPNAPLDVIEGYAWGHEWLLGTYKHPPMQAWWLELLADVTGRAHWAHFLASQISIVIAFWAVWQMGRRLVSERMALVAVMLLEGIVYYNFTSVEFNPNVLQLPFWALIGLYFHRSIKDGRLSDWALLGLFSACGLYTKYSTALLLMAFGILMLARPESRRRLSQKGPYVAAFVATALFLPHIVWLLQNDYLPFAYVLSRIEGARPVHHMAHADQFIMSQTLAILPMMVLLFTIVRRNAATPVFKKLSSFDRDFLNTIAFGPFVILLAISLFGIKVRDMWGTPLWGYAGLWAVTRLPVDFSERGVWRFVYGWAGICALTVVAYTGSILFLPYYTHEVQRVHFPGRQVAKIIDKGWHAQESAPLRYAIGDTWLAGNVAYYAEERPHVFIKGDPSISPWINLDDLKRSGAVLVWCIENCASHNFSESPPDIIKNYPQARLQEPIVLPRRTGAAVEPVKVGWAIVPPATQ